MRWFRVLFATVFAVFSVSGFVMANPTYGVVWSGGGAGGSGSGSEIDCVSTPVTTYAGDVTTGTNQGSTILYQSVTLVGVYGTLTSAPTTSPVIVDVNDLSGTIFTSAKLYFGPGEYNSLFSSAYTLVPPMDTDTVGFSSALTYDVDEVDDGNTAAGLVITECYTVD